MSETGDIEHKTTRNSQSMHECPTPHIYWRTYDDPENITRYTFYFDSIKMDLDAKSWDDSKKKKFVQRLIDENYISAEAKNYKKRDFDIYFDDCNAKPSLWYTVNEGMFTKFLRSFGRGGKSQKRRVIRRRSSTSRRNKRKTRRFRK